MQNFIGTKQEASYIYTDGSKELEEAANLLRIAHGTSTPGRPESNSRAEREIRTVLEGTRAILEHSGVPRRLWPYAADYFCHMLNTEVIGGESAWARRFPAEGNWQGPIIPFGALVDFKPTPTTRNRRRDKWHGKTYPGVFLGYHVQDGFQWSKDNLVSPLDRIGHRL